jgi:hypothetical protein
MNTSLVGSGAVSSGSLICSPCSIGSYKDAIGDWNTSCIACPATQTTQSAGSISSQACGCESGSYWNSSLLSCVACPIGYFQSSFGLTSCVACPSSFTTSRNGSISVSQCQCPMGYDYDSGSGGAAPVCNACSIGAYKGSFGNTSCSTCNGGIGTMNITGSISNGTCRLCVAGQFISTDPITGVRSCQTCSSITSGNGANGPVGYYTNSSQQAMTSIGVCQSCGTNTQTIPSVGATSFNQCSCANGYQGNHLTSNTDA